MSGMPNKTTYIILYGKFYIGQNNTQLKNVSNMTRNMHKITHIVQKKNNGDGFLRNVDKENAKKRPNNIQLPYNRYTC